MQIEFTNDEWAIKIKGIEHHIDADLKLEIDFDARYLTADVSQIYINTNPEYSSYENRRLKPELCTWERIDDDPECEFLVNAVYAWAETEDAISKLFEQAREEAA